MSVAQSPDLFYEQTIARWRHYMQDIAYELLIDIDNIIYFDKISQWCKNDYTYN